MHRLISTSYKKILFFYSIPGHIHILLVICDMHSVPDERNLPGNSCKPTLSCTGMCTPLNYHLKNPTDIPFNIFDAFGSNVVVHNKFFSISSASSSLNKILSASFFVAHSIAAS